MDAENEYEIKLFRDAVQMIQTTQSMIDVSADRLEGLRTQCSTSAVLTQQEIRTLEGKLVKHFSRQLVIKARFGDALEKELGSIPNLAQWLRVVGLCHDSIQAICSRVSSVDALRECSDHELRGLFGSAARDEEVRRLCRAMHRLRTYTDALSRGDDDLELPLYWDSWERHSRRPRGSLPAEDNTDSVHSSTPRKGGKSPTESNASTLTAPSSLTKSRSHEAQLCAPDANHLSSECATESPPASPREDNTPQHKPQNQNQQNNSAPRSPRTPTVGGRCMAHDIAHRFTKTFNMIATCDYCDKQMLFGAGLKCKECKFKCHRDCESKVPPSCGLPPELLTAFREKYHKDGGYMSGSPVPSQRGLFSLTHRPRRRHHQPNNVQPFTTGPDSSSTTSSCNSSAASSPAPHIQHTHPHSQHTHLHNTRHQQFHFPEVMQDVSSPGQSTSSPIRGSDAKDEQDNSANTENSRISLSGSASTDSELALRSDSVDDNSDAQRWPRQNSLSMKEWDIPYDELKLFEPIGRGRFGSVYRGCWHGAIAVKVIDVEYLSEDCKALDQFKHEVATFRKTRHENLVLFMGACMKPPRLAIVTSLCKGHTLYTHIHQHRDKFTANKTVIVAQQITQGMGYLHARGIIHKDLRSKNIFLEGGKVVITDFGLFSVTKLCYNNNARGDCLAFPAGWLCYLAPELVRTITASATVNLQFSKATDVYAFGTVWYELVCGEWPLKEQPAEALLWQVGRGIKQSLAHHARDVKDILMLCWAFRAQDRPTFSHLLNTLEKVPRKRLARSPSHPVQHLSRSADSVF